MALGSLASFHGQRELSSRGRFAFFADEDALMPLFAIDLERELQLFDPRPRREVEAIHLTLGVEIKSDHVARGVEGPLILLFAGGLQFAGRHACNASSPDDFDGSRKAMQLLLSGGS